MDKALFISIDTFRRDILGGKFQGVSCAPFLSGLKEKSLFYGNYYASCNWTIPAYAAMFTGAPTVRHNFWSYKHYPKKPQRFVFDVLSENGVKCALMHSGGPLNPGLFQYNRDNYYADGHDVFDLDRTLDRVISLIEENDFVFYHTFLLHDYLFHRRLMPNRFGIKRPYRFIGKARSWLMGRKVGKWVRGEGSLRITKKTVSLLERMYYNDCLMTDAFMEVLYKEVVKRYPDIKIVINSDHGECFTNCGKHQRLPEDGKMIKNPLMGHGSGQCYEQFEVMMMLHDPANPEGAVAKERIDHEDVYDLILSMYGLGEFPRRDKDRHLVSTGYNYVGNCGVLEGEDFYLYNYKDDAGFRFLMYDNLYTDDMKDVGEEGVAHYRSILEYSLRQEEEFQEADEQTMEQLRALGYLD